MNKYYVELEYIYVIKVEVEAESRDEAEQRALEMADGQEEFSRYHDCEIVLLKEDK